MGKHYWNDCAGMFEKRYNRATEKNSGESFLYED